MIVLRFVGYTIILGVNIIEHPEFYSQYVKLELLKKDRKNFMKCLRSLFCLSHSIFFILCVSVQTGFYRSRMWDCIRVC